MVTKHSFVRRIIFKEYFLFVNIRSIQEPVPLKNVLFFMRQTKLWLPIKDNMLGLEDLKLKSPSTNLLSYSFE